MDVTYKIILQWMPLDAILRGNLVKEHAGTKLGSGAPHLTFPDIHYLIAKIEALHCIFKFSEKQVPLKVIYFLLLLDTSSCSWILSESMIIFCH